MRTPRTPTWASRLAVLAAVPLLALSACGGGDAFDEDAGSGGESSGGSDGGGGEITVGGADFTEMIIMQEMYRLVLEDAGYTVDVKSVGQREIYAPSLESGEIDVVPEYAATMAEYLNREANGPDAEPIATTDAQETVEAMRPLAEEKGLTILEPSEALSANGFYVSQDFAEQNDLETLSDLGELGQPVTIAAGDECIERPFCAVGLTETYGIEVTGVTGDDFGSATGKQKVVDGEAQLGLSGTTDGTLEGLGLVLLEDDKKLQAADNLVPIINTEQAGDPEIAEALDALSQELTTEDLTTMNGKVDGERQQAEDVAREYLEEKGLIGG
jgi:osmoprotectant transport system substrate-binding protein